MRNVKHTQAVNMERSSKDRVRFEVLSLHHNLSATDREVRTSHMIVILKMACWRKLRSGILPVDVFANAMAVKSSVGVKATCLTGCREAETAPQINEMNWNQTLTSSFTRFWRCRCLWLKRRSSFVKRSNGAALLALHSLLHESKKQN